MNSETTYYIELLKREFEGRIDRNRAYSLRAFARGMGIQVSALSEVLSGKRIPSYKLSQKILNSLGFSPTDEKTFMASVAQAHQARNPQRLSQHLKDLTFAKAPSELSLDLFRIIGDWYHYAILFLTEIEEFDSSPLWISKQLGISVSEAKLAIDRLLKLEMLKIENGKLKIWENRFTTADKHITTPGQKRHLQQILHKAIDSLENDPIENRSMTAMTMAIDPEKLSDAKKMIEDFTQKLSTFLESGKKQSIFELNINLFPLQKK